MKTSLPAVFLLATLISPSAYASCGGAFCSLNTNWDVQGVWDKPGIRLDLRAEFIDLDQLQSGTSKAVPAGAVGEHDEVRTINRNFVATLDWSIDPEWGVTIRAPLVSRSHNHIHNDPLGPETETWSFTEIGDIQAVGRYTFYQDGDGDAGLRFGLKLPTGSTSQKNDAGEQAERTLQPGTGSTDNLLGLYYHGHLKSGGWFVQGMWQQTIHEQADFRPGRHLSLDVGMNYNLTPEWNLMLQLNAQHKSRDSGTNAEPDDSGSTKVFLSPGISYRATKDTQVYGFLQQPLYQHVNGTQLVSDWSVAFGISTQF